jgi:hypothetical protein
MIRKASSLEILRKRRANYHNPVRVVNVDPRTNVRAALPTFRQRGAQVKGVFYVAAIHAPARAGAKGFILRRA